jgi:hypothetical protein
VLNLKLQWGFMFYRETTWGFVYFPQMFVCCQ